MFPIQTEKHILQKKKVNSKTAVLEKQCNIVATNRWELTQLFIHAISLIVVIPIVTSQH